MKTTELNTEKTFDVALAEKRIDEIKSKDAKLESSIEYKIQQAIQKLIQIILQNVTISKGTEIGLRINDESFVIEYIYNKEKNYSYDIKINFVRKYDVRHFLNDEEKERIEKRNIKVGDIKDVEFRGITIGFFKNEDEGSEMHFEYISLQSYIAKELTKGGEFISTLKFYYAEIRDITNQREKLWEECRELNSKKDEHLENIYEQEIRKSNYFVEGNVIIVRHIKKEFVEASVYEIKKVQKTTFYCLNRSIQISSVYHTKEERYAPRLENYGNYKDKRHDIETFIRIWASERLKGDRIEVLSSVQWEKLQKDMQKEHDDMRDNKLSDLSKRYHTIKYKRDEN